jgi:NDP-hexose 4,6-dehydratase
MSCFITGATGFIGHHLVPRLTQTQAVTVLQHGHTKRPEGAQSVEGDLRKASTLPNLRDTQTIVHLAAISSVPACQADPRQAFEVNTTGTLNLLEAARRSEALQVFLHMSTGHVYGRPLTLPISEEHPLGATSIYGATKLAAERLVQSYHHTYGLPTVIIRAFNVYGPHQAPGFLIPELITNLKQGKPPLLGNGALERDFLYIDDFIDLILRALTNPKANGHVLNAGSGQAIRLENLAATLMKIAKVSGEPKPNPDHERKDDPPRVVVDNRKARTLLNWTPSTPPEAGLRKTWESTPTPRPNLKS